MAGYALGFADGGAIPDDQDDGVTQETPEGENYTPPPQQEGSPEPDEASEGALPGAYMENPQPSTPMPQPGGIADTLAPDQSGSGIFKKGVQAALAYLKGADAAPPQVAHKFSQGVKAQHPGISDDDANLVAVQKAYELGGPDAAHAMLQFNRVAYNAKQSFALAALTGGQSKPADPNAAALAATQASAHVLDGSQASFQPTQGGFTATVKIPGTTRLVKYDLTPQQFAQYLNPAGAGQWDKLMQGGIPAALDQTTKGAGQGGDSDDEDNSNDKLHIAANLPPDFQDTYTKGDEYPTWLKARADEYGYTLPPKGVVGTVPSSNATARQQYMDNAENQYLTRKANLEGQIAHGLALSEAWGARALGTENAAKTRAGAQIASAGIRANSANRNTDVRAGVSRDAILAKTNGELNKLAANRNNMLMGENAKNARAAVNAYARNNPNVQGQELQDYITQTYKKFGLNPGFAAPTSVTTQQPQQQQQRPQQVQAPDVGNIAPPRHAWVPDGAKFFRGQWYTRGPQGEAVPVQQPK